ncbi:MAG: site-2 protease family protein, partial [Clostridia bacterium]|nr:site-2 protease family protein [Clostridia bacterium]
LGGFCAFEGEDGDKDEVSLDTFTSKAPWKRIIVLIAGPLMNYVLALFLIIISMFGFGQQVFKIGGMEQVEGEDTAIYTEHSLEEGDLILKVNGKKIYLVTDIMSALDGKKQGDTVPVEVSNNGERITRDIVLRDECEFESSAQTSIIWRAFGVGTVVTDERKFWNINADNYRYGFFETLGDSFVYSFKIAGTIFKVLGELFTGSLGLNAMGGPVTTIKLTSEIASQGLQSFLEIASYIGVNLAVFNLLPIPALDGSKVIFCLIEWIFKKPVPRKVEAVIHGVGFILILVFAVVVDILQFAHC